jgi:hypothetical protein
MFLIITSIKIMRLHHGQVINTRVNCLISSQLNSHGRDNYEELGCEEIAVTRQHILICAFILPSNNKFILLLDLTLEFFHVKVKIVRNY